MTRGPAQLGELGHQRETGPGDVSYAQHQPRDRPDHLCHSRISLDQDALSYPASTSSCAASQKALVHQATHVAESLGSEMSVPEFNVRL